MTSEGYTLQDLAAALDARFPFAWADTWDRVGLVIGDPSLRLTGVLVTLDASGAAVERAVEAGANALVTHHPPFLEAPVHPVRSSGPQGTLARALAHSVGVIALHTNLDRAPAGAEALPLTLGLVPGEPLEDGVEEVSVVTTYVPPHAEVAVREAMAAAAAGRIGQYHACAYVAPGVGHFRSGEGARPASLPAAGGVSELRVEMVCPRSAAVAVLAAARAAHPYEEPVIIAVEGLRARGVAQHGRVCTWNGAGTVGELARHVSRTLGAAVRVWGDPGNVAARIAIANGSGSSLIPVALDRADVLVTGEVRYHDALDAVAGGLAIIEAGHDATEWPMVPLLAEAVRAALPPGVPVVEEAPTLAWLTMEDTHDGV